MADWLRVAGADGHLGSAVVLLGQVDAAGHRGMLVGYLAWLVTRHGPVSAVFSPARAVGHDHLCQPRTVEWSVVVMVAGAGLERPEAALAGQVALTVYPRHCPG